MFPKGNGKADHFAIYLDVADSATLPYGWSRDIKFSLSVINQIYKTFTVKKDAQHQFCAKESDWGFTSFMLLSGLSDAGRGYLVNDTCVVEVDFPGFSSDELKVEEGKTALAKGTRQIASGTHTILPQTNTLVPPTACESDTEVIKTSVPPTTPIVEKESMVNSSQAQYPVNSFYRISINNALFFIFERNNFLTCESVSKKKFSL
ncbi:MATH domain and coiled-coil domain-containing protein At3g58340-like [Cornus florida]|uniref:MATH domain and coiled-coil domain-containing protein At3g58340-like n=1 Tax=Cornus florida TaxID=4283 RepID=UPI00289CE059|nr:MATH domain and coiled-coil domain-containing protein At3g58340-like [Cornus florida]